MAKGLFLTGTGTDVGKTYVAGLLVKAMRKHGLNTGYYKAAISGAPSVADSDAGYVNRIASIGEDESMILSYLYDHAVSPHLAAKLEGNPVEKDVVLRDFKKVAAVYDYVLMEGSGGIVCPIRYDEQYTYLLEDLIQWLHLPTVIVGRAGLGTINEVVLTVEYLKARHIPVKGVILNNYQGGVMEEDNHYMIEQLTGLPVLGHVAPGDKELSIDSQVLTSLFDSIE